MGTEETVILKYLKTFPHQYVSGKQIARKAWDRKKFDKNPHWALPILTRMVREKLLITDNMGGFRITPEETEDHGAKKHLPKKVEETIKKVREEAHGAELDADHGSNNPPGH